VIYCFTVKCVSTFSADGGPYVAVLKKHSEGV